VILKGEPEVLGEAPVPVLVPIALAWDRTYPRDERSATDRLRHDAACECQVDRCNVQGVSSVVSLRTAALSHTKPASAGRSRDSCGAQDSSVKIFSVYPTGMCRSVTNTRGVVLCRDITTSSNHICTHFGSTVEFFNDG
jgi:hypothetical protein